MPFTPLFYKWSGGVDTIITYIIQTLEGEYYCGKTNNLTRRLNEHQKESSPHWFSMKQRKVWKRVTIIEGDWEKKIKKFGVKNYWETCKNARDEYFD